MLYSIYVRWVKDRLETQDNEFTKTIVRLLQNKPSYEISMML